MRDPYPWGRSERVTVAETGVAFHVAWKGCTMFPAVFEDNQGTLYNIYKTHGGELNFQPH